MINMRKHFIYFLLAFLWQQSAAQDSTRPGKEFKNVVRYNLSGPILFGPKYLVFGYERVVGKNQSISVNFGRARLPKLVSVITDSFELKSDRKNTGYNFSVDYRFYLANENKHAPPHGVYIGPYYSFNRFERENTWDFKKGGVVNNITTDTRFNVHTIGCQLGYQFVLWKRITLDMVLIGPGLGSYDLETVIDGSLNTSEKGELIDAVQQLLTQRFPGMNFVFSDKEIKADGVMRTWTVGFRYVIHVGFRF
jgi:hypothetical protein